MELYDTNWLQQLETVGAALIAALLGGVIGLEREIANRPAGLRTHALLAAAAALLVGLSNSLIGYFVDESATDVLRADPVRIIEAIVTGTAFLGAGTIFRHHGREAVEGLTTAASLLLVAAIGVAVGLRQLLVAALVTLLALVLLRVFARYTRSRR